jgi:hypothetical protein
MSVNAFFIAVEELGYDPKEVTFKCDKNRPNVLVVTLKKNGAIVGLYDTVAQWWL